jgi:hypothetical protein
MGVSGDCKSKKDSAQFKKYSIKSSQATSCVSCGQNSNVSGTISASIIRGMMMEAEMVSEMLGFCPQLTRLVARENLIGTTCCSRKFNQVQSL